KCLKLRKIQRPCIRLPKNRIERFFEGRGLCLESILIYPLGENNHLFPFLITGEVHIEFSSFVYFKTFPKFFNGSRKVFCNNICFYLPFVLFKKRKVFYFHYIIVFSLEILVFFFLSV